jgi:hypothetical protein
LSADHLQRLADVRIAQGLQDQILNLCCCNRKEFLDNNDLKARLKSAGIEVT